jgi:hypothetical protein
MPSPKGGRRLAVSVDLDPLRAYFQIHGLHSTAVNTANLETLDTEIVAKGIERFVDLADELDLMLTFFVVGETMRGAARTAAAEAVRRGHELANHTQHHPYAFLRLGETAMEKEIQTGHETIAAITKTPPRGFRAPGYGNTPALLSLLRKKGYRYDSSLLPSPLYYFAKVAIMAWMRHRGRRSGATVHDPRTAFGPNRPYIPRSDAPHRPQNGFHLVRGGPTTAKRFADPVDRRITSALVELPISVSAWTRIPLIGTTLALAFPGLDRWLSFAAQRLPVVNFEFHAIDLVDAQKDRIPPPLVAKQPDLQISVARKRARFYAFLRRLKKTHDACTLSRIAADTIDRNEPHFGAT